MVPMIGSQFSKKKLPSHSLGMVCWPRLASTTLSRRPGAVVFAPSLSAIRCGHEDEACVEDSAAVVTSHAREGYFDLTKPDSSSSEDNSDSDAEPERRCAHFDTEFCEPDLELIVTGHPNQTRTAVAASRKTSNA